MISSDVPDDLQSLISDLVQVVEELDATARWAGEEIAVAAAQHPAAAEAVNDSFPLLMPSNPVLVTEELYRAHCVELLDRVVRGADTRPGTAVECCIVLSKVSLEVPLPTHAVGLYARMWRQAGLPANELAAMGAHYEAIAGTQIDDLEAEMRQKLWQDWRIQAKRREQ
ncbi:hypothetical protein [Virgisporangium aurantiacum]|uniref:Uncharacterized protein n=1 Tax=Virgisporangium aurantiacum TaxID=175570 RepID=A0A8J3ZN35_9ACTN|nr:hypothetical protein [Virgisporangium aurantiacum]GIJ64475.1 hypothetical protein Vau01_119910 [Virgisporangium aurantiacum]